MTEELNEQQGFYKKLEDIIDMLGTCYDRLDLLIQKDENGNDVADNGTNIDLRLAQQKIREANLLLKDTMDNLLRYD